MEFKVVVKNDDGEYIHESEFMDSERAMSYIRCYVVLNSVCPTPLAVDGATVAEFCECGISIESHTGVGCLYRPATNA